MATTTENTDFTVQTKTRKQRIRDLVTIRKTLKYEESRPLLGETSTMDLAEFNFRQTRSSKSADYGMDWDFKSPKIPRWDRVDKYPYWDEFVVKRDIEYINGASPSFATYPNWGFLEEQLLLEDFCPPSLVDNPTRVKYVDPLRSVYQHAYHTFDEASFIKLCNLSLTLNIIYHSLFEQDRDNYIRMLIDCIDYSDLRGVRGLTQLFQLEHSDMKKLRKLNKKILDSVKVHFNQYLLTFANRNQDVLEEQVLDEIISIPRNINSTLSKTQQSLDVASDAVTHSLIDIKNLCHQTSTGLDSFIQKADNTVTSLESKVTVSLDQMNNLAQFSTNKLDQVVDSIHNVTHTTNDTLNSVNSAILENSDKLKSLINSFITNEPTNNNVINSMFLKAKENWPMICLQVYNLTTIDSPTSFGIGLITLMNYLGLDQQILTKLYTWFSSPGLIEQSGTIKLMAFLSCMLGKNSPLHNLLNVSSVFTLTRETKTITELMDLFKEVASEWGFIVDEKAEFLDSVKKEVVDLNKKLVTFEIMEIEHPSKYFFTKHFTPLEQAYNRIKELEQQNFGKLSGLLGKDLHETIVFSSKKYSELYKRVISLKRGTARRQEPVALIFMGAPGIGKSKFCTDLITNEPKRDSLLTQRYKALGYHMNKSWEDLPIEDWQVWNENVSDKMDFSDGYVGQDIHATDDLFQSSSHNDHARYINYISTQMYITNQASLERKGLPYEAKLFVGSCNQFPRTSKTINSVEALQRRFIIVEVTKTGTMPKTYDSDFKHLTFNVHATGVDYVNGVPSQTMTKQQLTDYILAKLKVKYDSYMVETGEQAGSESLYDLATPITLDRANELSAGTQIPYLYDSRITERNLSQHAKCAWYTLKVDINDGLFPIKDLIADPMYDHWASTDYILNNAHRVLGTCAFLKRSPDWQWSNFKNGKLVQFFLVDHKFYVYSEQMDDEFDHFDGEYNPDDTWTGYFRDLYEDFKFSVYSQASKLWKFSVDLFRKGANALFDFYNTTFDPLMGYFQKIVVDILGCVSSFYDFAGNYIISRVITAVVISGFAHCYTKISKYLTHNSLCEGCSSVDKQYMDNFKNEFCKSTCNIGFLYTSHTKSCKTFSDHCDRFQQIVCCSHCPSPRCEHNIDLSERDALEFRNLFMTVFQTFPFDQYLESGPDCKLKKKIVQESGPTVKVQKKVVLESGPTTKVQKKLVTESGPTVRIKKKHIAELEEEMSEDKNAQELSQSLYASNIIRCYRNHDDKRGALFGLGFRNYVITPAHFFKFGCSYEAQVRGNMYKMTLITKEPTRDVALFKIVDKTFQNFNMKLYNSLITTKDLAIVERTKHFLLLLGETARRPYHINFPVKVKKLNHESLFVGSNFKDYDEIFKVTNMSTFSVPTESGDCGSPIIMFNPKSPNKIVGFHIIGGAAESYASVVTKELIDRMVSCDKLNEEIAVEALDIPTRFVVIDHGNLLKDSHQGSLYRPEGEIDFIGKYKYSTTPASKSDLDKHVLFETFPVTKIPATLKDSEVKDSSKLALSNKGPSIVQTQFNKYSKIMSPISSSELTTMIDELSEHYISVLKDCDLSTMSDTEIFNGLDYMVDSKGMDMVTTAGEPWSKLGKNPLKKNSYCKLSTDIETGKKYYNLDTTTSHGQQLADFMEYKEYQATRGNRVLSLWKNCLKDETRPIEKAEIGKTRLFTAAPIDVVYIGRKFFGKFKDNWQHNRSNLFHSVGINPMSLEWGQLANSLRSKGCDFSDADFSSYDGSLRADFMRAAGEVVFNTINAISGTDITTMRTIWEDYIETFHVTENDVHLTYHGNPSGNPMTTVVNCIVNLMYHWWCYYKITGFSSLASFDSDIGFTCFGDDVVYSTNSLKTGYTFNKVADLMKDLDQDYTTAAKDSTESALKTIEDITFLKRRFVSVSKTHWLAPLDHDSIEQQFNYTQVGELDHITIASQLREASIEACLHGKQYYSSFAKSLRNSIRTRDLDYKILSHADAYKLAESRCFGPELQEQILNMNVNNNTCISGPCPNQVGETSKTFFMKNVTIKFLNHFDFPKKNFKLTSNYVLKNFEPLKFKAESQLGQFDQLSKVFHRYERLPLCKLNALGEIISKHFYVDLSFVKTDLYDSFCVVIRFKDSNVSNFDDFYSTQHANLKSAMHKCVERLFKTTNNGLDFTLTEQMDEDDSTLSKPLSGLNIDSTEKHKVVDNDPNIDSEYIIDNSTQGQNIQGLERPLVGTETYGFERMKVHSPDGEVDALVMHDSTVDSNKLDFLPSYPMPEQGNVWHLFSSDVVTDSTSRDLYPSDPFVSPRTSHVLEMSKNFRANQLYKLVCPMPLFSFTRFEISFGRVFTQGRGYKTFTWNPTVEPVLYILVPYYRPQYVYTESFRDNAKFFIPPQEIVGRKVLAGDPCISIKNVSNYQADTVASSTLKIYSCLHDCHMYTPTPVGHVRNSQGTTPGDFYLLQTAPISSAAAETNLVSLEYPLWDPIERDILQAGAWNTTGNLTLNTQLWSEAISLEEQIFEYNMPEFYETARLDHGNQKTTASIDNQLWTRVVNLDLAYLADQTEVPFNLFNDFERFEFSSFRPLFKIVQNSNPSVNARFRLTYALDSSPSTTANDSVYYQLPGIEFDAKTPEFTFRMYWNKDTPVTRDTKLLIKISLIGGTIDTNSDYQAYLYLAQSGMEYHHVRNQITSNVVLQEQMLEETVSMEPASALPTSALTVPETDQRFQYVTAFPIAKETGLVSIPITSKVFGGRTTKVANRYKLWRGEPMFKIVLNNPANVNASFHVFQSSEKPPLGSTISADATVANCVAGMTGTFNRALTFKTHWRTDREWLAVDNSDAAYIENGDLDSDFVLGYIHLVIAENSASSATVGIPTNIVCTILCDASSVAYKYPAMVTPPSMTSLDIITYDRAVEMLTVSSRCFHPNTRNNLNSRKRKFN